MGPLEHIVYEFVLTSPAVSRMSGSSYFDSFSDGWLVATQLLFCGMLLPGLVQYSSLHFYGIAVRLFLHTLGAYLVHPYNSIHTTAAWEKMHFILSVRSDFHITDSLSIAVHAFACRVQMSLKIKLYNCLKYSKSYLCLASFIRLTTYQPLIGYLMPKFDMYN